MRTNIFILFSLLIGLVSCSKPEGQELRWGYIDLKGIDITVDGEVIPLTRAVDPGLQVQIWQNGVLVEGKDYAPGTDLSKRIVLPIGNNYKVKAFTPDQIEAGNDEPGHPVFSVESEPFEIREADITTLSLVVPQINVGVGMSCEELFAAEFTDITVTVVSESGRSVTITGPEDQGYRYFTLPLSGKLNYVIQATNKDGEVMQKNMELPVTTKNYKINLAID